MEIKHLKTFKAIIDCGGFTKAAEYLSYSQSTVTFHIKALEVELGYKVFDRIGRNTILNEAGKDLIPFVIKILNDYKELKDSSTYNGEIHGELIISAPEAILVYRLPEVLKEYKKLFPKVDIHLKHLDPLRFKNELKDGEIDLAFFIDVEREYREIFSEKLVDEPMMIITTEPNSLKSPKHLSNPTFLFTEQGCSYRKILENYMKQNSFDFTNSNSLEFESIDAIKKCILNNFGITALPYITIQDEITHHEIFAQKLDENLATYIGIHKDKWISPPIKMFLNMIKKYAVAWKYQVEHSNYGVV